MNIGGFAVRAAVVLVLPVWIGVAACAAVPRLQPLHNKEYDMQWIDPAYCDIRLGFEVTAYVYVR